MLKEVNYTPGVRKLYVSYKENDCVHINITTIALASEHLVVKKCDRYPLMYTGNGISIIQYFTTFYK